jgi:hypothetical protein
MAKQITVSVGQGGVNRAPDVWIVQFHRSLWSATPDLRDRIVAPVVSGTCDAVTVAAIGTFQTAILGFLNQITESIPMERLSNG